MNRFETKLAEHRLTLRRGDLQTLQINVGRKCNQTCRHCHVDAAPWRTEMMPANIARRVGEWIREHRPPVVDITGGAPELSEHFRYFVETGREAGCHVIDRNNLTIIETRAFAWLPEYLAAHEVEVVASLPCYSAENVNAQRGHGVFEKSISALKKLNAVGYGTKLPLNLVFNPLGAKLPGPQAELEADFKDVLSRDFGIVFNQLFAITNQPIARFAEDLRQHGQWDEYLELLASHFNPATVEGLMCRSTISIGWMGEVFDCDFNQMLKMQVRNGKPLYLWDVTPVRLEGWDIQTGVHCLACTAGCGSSCTGAMAEEPGAAEALQGCTTARGDRVLGAGHSTRAVSISPSSPCEERAGRGLRRGGTHKDAPPLPSPPPSDGREGEIEELDAALPRNAQTASQSRPNTSRGGCYPDTRIGDK